jgi:hypothetical protein
LKGALNNLTDQSIDFTDISDKKDFSTHLKEEVLIADPFFEEDVKIFSTLLDLKTESEIFSSDAITDLTGDLFKGVIEIPDSYFHYFPDFVGPIIIFLENCIKKNIEKVEVIAIKRQSILPTVDNFYPFLQHCLEKFADRIEVVYREVDQSQKIEEFGEGFIKINKSRIIDQQDIGISLQF